jgi:hypothetical protein
MRLVRWFPPLYRDRAEGGRPLAGAVAAETVFGLGVGTELLALAALLVFFKGPRLVLARLASRVAQLSASNGGVLCEPEAWSSESARQQEPGPARDSVRLTLVASRAVRVGGLRARAGT